MEWLSVKISLSRGLPGRPYLMGMVTDGGGGTIANADTEQGELSVPFLVDTQPP